MVSDSVVKHQPVEYRQSFFGQIIDKLVEMVTVSNVGYGEGSLV